MSESRESSVKLILSRDELAEITGYVQQSKQLAELHRLGFWRARMQAGEVILERAHYNAVCAGASPPVVATGRVHQFKPA